MNLISPAALAARDQHKRQFAKAQPFRHVVIDGFFDTSFCENLLSDFPQFENRFALNEMGELGKKAVRVNVRDISETYRRLDDFLQTHAFLDYVGAVTGIDGLLYDSDYVGGGTHENLDGQSLDTHVDFNYHPRTQTHRRLNLIVYLNPEWEEQWGGALELHSDPWNATTDRKLTVLPLFNRAVIFETNEVSWHGFEEIRLPAEKKTLSRKSFAIYLYTKERPAAETAPAHATVYVPEGMPADWQPGHKLNDTDMRLLRSRFAHLRGLLRYQYEREKHDSTQLDAVRRMLEEARTAWRLPIQGYLAQSKSPQGMWCDGWAGPHFTTTMIPQKAMRGIELELYTPKQLPANQVLSITVDNQRWEHHIARGGTSKVALNIKRAAGLRVEMQIDAAQCFIPASTGESGDDRELAWLLREARVVH